MTLQQFRSRQSYWHRTDIKKVESDRRGSDGRSEIVLTSSVARGELKVHLRPAVGVIAFC